MKSKKLHMWESLATGPTQQKKKKKGQQVPPMCSPKRLAGTNKADYNEVNRLFLLLVR